MQSRCVDPAHAHGPHSVSVTYRYRCNPSGCDAVPEIENVLACDEHAGHHRPDVAGASVQNQLHLSDAAWLAFAALIHEVRERRDIERLDWCSGTAVALRPGRDIVLDGWPAEEWLATNRHNKICSAVDVKEAQWRGEDSVARRKSLLSAPDKDGISRHRRSRGEQMREVASDRFRHEATIRETHRMNTILTDGESSVHLGHDAGDKTKIVHGLAHTASSRIPSCTERAHAALRINEKEALRLGNVGEIRAVGKAIGRVPEPVESEHQRNRLTRIIQSWYVEKPVSRALWTTVDEVRVLSVRPLHRRSRNWWRSEHLPCLQRFPLVHPLFDIWEQIHALILW